jgi:motility quorum-sensing regulator / GCU-specific mRNA interferase toxin
MEKRTPHYTLSVIQADVLARGHQAFTLTARRNGAAMGLTGEQMIQTVCDLTRHEFYKSMTTHADCALWQDVYRAMTPLGKVAYIKITGHKDGQPPVIQFKEQ